MPDPDHKFATVDGPAAPLVLSTSAREFRAPGTRVKYAHTPRLSGVSSPASTQAVSAQESKAERSMRDTLPERGRVGEDRQEPLDAILTIVADPAVPDEQVAG